jgi:hypothetical protein
MYAGSFHVAPLHYSNHPNSILSPFVYFLLCTINSKMCYEYRLGGWMTTPNTENTISIKLDIFRSIEASSLYTSLYFIDDA